MLDHITKALFRLRIRLYLMYMYTSNRFVIFYRTIANYLIWRIMKNRINNLGQNFQELVTEYNKVCSGEDSVFQKA